MDVSKWNSSLCSWYVCDMVNLIRGIIICKILCIHVCSRCYRKQTLFFHKLQINCFEIHKHFPITSNLAMYANVIKSLLHDSINFYNRKCRVTFKARRNLLHVFHLGLHANAQLYFSNTMRTFLLCRSGGHVCRFRTFLATFDQGICIDTTE